MYIIFHPPYFLVVVFCLPLKCCCTISTKENKKWYMITTIKFVYNSTDLERSTLVVACIRSTYIFMRGSNAPLSEQTWASDSSTPRPIRFSWYCTTQPVTYSDQSLTLLLKKSQTFLLMIQESKEQVCGFHNSSWGTWNYDIWNKVPSGYLYFEYHLPYRWEVLASEWTFRYIGLPWAGKFHICAEVRNMII